MRNLFDQYSQPENRLSHALAVCLDEDRRLLQEFLAWAGVQSPARVRDLLIVEQSLPGDPPESELEAERIGLPDIVVHDDDGWCLLVESKVQAPLTEDQLRRHERTLRRRGFEGIHCVALTKSGVRTPKGTIAATWSGLYEWLGTARIRSEWSDRLRAYLRAAEVRLAQEEYLTEGTLTMFDGFPFSDDNPYTYGEAKRLLKLALKELRKDRALIALGMDPKAPGRTAITGRGGRVVWDFLPLKDRPRRGAFTGYPHLTLAVHADHLEASITIPNGVIRPVRQRLIDLGSDRLSTINAKILRRARRLISRGAWVQAYALQRHYLGQRSPAITDAMLTFRLETSQSRNSGRVKRQPEWVELFAALPRRKRSNIQFQYRVHLPWGTKGLNSRDSLGLIVDSWTAMKPLLDALRGEP
ncbi:MAG: hypothetical protein Q8L55_03915 [Phycisphaerales bacterium]|nr:hypothetical protein [Phycisphaerales bacterium]